MMSFPSMRVRSRSIIVFCLVLSLFTTVIYGQAISKTVNIETVVLYNFETADEWRPIESASRFFFKGSKTNDSGVVMQYPNITVYPHVPFGMGSKRANSTNSLGIRVSFFRKSYNFFDFVPTEQKYVPGRALSFDVWVWGANYNYTMDLVLEDYKGYTHALPLGSLRYIGWRNLSVNVPTTIPQADPYVPRQKSLKFLNFRFWSSPEERVDNFVVLLDYFQTVSDTFRDAYDGNDIEDTLIKENSGNNNGNGNGSANTAQ